MGTVTTHADRLTVRFDDGGDADFHYVWLRDNCTCPDCRHPDAWERLHDTALMSDDLHPRSALLHDRLEVEWPDGHRTSLSQGWLRAHTYGATARAARRPALRTWDATIAEDLPTIPFADIAAGDEGLRRWLRLIADLGFALVRGVPTEVDEVVRLAQRIADIQPSNFGRTFHVISKPDPENLAYTAVGLHPHSDIPNRHSAVNLQLLHCLRFGATGGESVLVDGFDVARRLREDDPAAYDLLARVEIPWRFVDDTTEIRNHAPVLDVDGDGVLRQVRYNTAIMGAIDIDPELVVPYYDALRRFGRMLRDPAAQLRFAMAPGDCQIFDNVRVLHGRGAFDPQSGERHLQGCYVDRDDALGRLRALERRGADFRLS